MCTSPAVLRWLRPGSMEELVMARDAAGLIVI
jgi:hypothetical protein